jgi:hypothetical protein
VWSQESIELKFLAMQSLAIYASAARYFVVIAPTAMHENELECNFASYGKRAWARLEQWARISGGSREMYVYDDAARQRGTPF